MSRLDSDTNVLHARIVYWGPAASGKTTTLRALRSAVDPEGRSRLYSLASGLGDTVYFDLLPLEEFTFGPHRARIRVVGVPGAPERGASRRTLLADADAVVFVADSARASLAANQASARELAQTLTELGAAPGALPVVWSLNGRDRADATPAAELREALQIGQAPCFETAATAGEGVFEAFSRVFNLLLISLAKRHAIPAPEPANLLPAQFLPQLARSLASRRRPASSADDRHLVLQVGAAGPGRDEATETQLRMAESHAELDAAGAVLQGRNRELMAINRVARSILSAMEIDNLLVVLLDATAEYLGASHISCVVFDPTNQSSLKTHVHGFGRDPVLRLPQFAAQAFFALMQSSDGPILLAPTSNPALFEALQGVDRRVRRAVFQPMKGAQGKPAGWLGIYAKDDEASLGTQHLLFLSAISRFASLGLEKIALLDSLQRGRARFEEELQERTSKLEMTQARVRALNRGMEARVAERTRALEEANRELRESSARAAHASRVRGMGDLAASFAHEVNNPVAGLAGNLDFMRESVDELRAKVAAGTKAGEEALGALADFEQVIEECRQGTERISGVIASLKRFGGEEEARETISINAAVADAVTLLEERIRACAELDLRLGSVPEIHGNSLELSHVVLELLTNAVEGVERAGEGGTITVTTFTGGGRATLTVKDTGCGIEPALLARVFEPFVSSKDGEPSAGLGLHCAYQTVERHGGQVRIRSKPGQGTTVTVELPVGAGAPAAAPERERTA